MKTSIDLDKDLSADVERTASLLGENPATVLRMAIQAGLPLVAVRFQAAAPKGYFTEDYKETRRVKFERAMSKVKQRAER